MILVAGNMAEWDFLFDFVLRFFSLSQGRGVGSEERRKVRLRAYS